MEDNLKLFKELYIQNKESLLEELKELLVKEGYTAHGQPEEYIKALQKHGLDRFIDPLAAMFHGFI